MARRGEFAQAGKLLRLYLDNGAPESEAADISKRAANFERQAALKRVH